MNDVLPSRKFQTAPPDKPDQANGPLGPEPPTPGGPVNYGAGGGGGDFRPPEFTDEALALRFAEVHAENLRYVALLGNGIDGTVPAGSETPPSWRSIMPGTSAERPAPNATNPVSPNRLLAPKQWRRWNA